MPEKKRRWKKNKNTWKTKDGRKNACDFNFYLILQFRDQDGF